MRRRRRATMRARRVGARLAHARGHRWAHTTVKSTGRYTGRGPRASRHESYTRVCSLPAENIGNRGNSREERWNKLAELCTWYYRFTGTILLQYCTVAPTRTLHLTKDLSCTDPVSRGANRLWSGRVRTEPASPMPCMPLAEHVPISFGRVPSFPWQSSQASQR